MTADNLTEEELEAVVYMINTLTKKEYNKNVDAFDYQLDLTVEQNAVKFVKILSSLEKEVYGGLSA